MPIDLLTVFNTTNVTGPYPLVTPNGVPLGVEISNYKTWLYIQGKIINSGQASLSMDWPTAFWLSVICAGLVVLLIFLRKYNIEQKKREGPKYKPNPLLQALGITIVISIGIFVVTAVTGRSPGFLQFLAPVAIFAGVYVFLRSLNAEFIKISEKRQKKIAQEYIDLFLPGYKLYAGPDTRTAFRGYAPIEERDGDTLQSLGGFLVDVGQEKGNGSWVYKGSVWIEVGRYGPARLGKFIYRPEPKWAQERLKAKITASDKEEDTAKDVQDPAA